MTSSCIFVSTIGKAEEGELFGQGKCSTCAIDKIKGKRLLLSNQAASLNSTNLALLSTLVTAKNIKFVFELSVRFTMIIQW